LENNRNTPDRAKLGSKIHPLVDPHAQPLAVQVTGADENDNSRSPGDGIASEPA